MNNFIANHSAVHNYLHLNASFSDDIGIFNGKAGVALYLSQIDTPFCRNEVLVSFINEILNQVDDTTPLSYGYGVSGIGYLLEYFLNLGVVNQDLNEILEEVHPRIVRSIQSAKIADIGLDSGVSGIGMYFIARLDSVCRPSKLHINQMHRALDNIFSLILDRNNRTIEMPLNIFKGIGGILLFLHKARTFCSPGSKLTMVREQLLSFLFDKLAGPFSWDQIYGWVVLVEMGRELTESHRSQFSRYTDWCLLKATPPPLHQMAAFASLLHRASQKNSFLNFAVLANSLFDHITHELKSVHISTRYGYDSRLRSVPIGIENGVSAIALTISSFETTDWRWLAVIGIN